MGKFVPLSPQRKGKKAAHELKTGKRFCNDGEPKKGGNGQQLKVTKVGRAYRHGYLDARKDIGRAVIRKKKVSTAGKRKENPYNDFVYTPTGRIKGAYNVDGFFEPD